MSAVEPDPPAARVVVVVRHAHAQSNVSGGDRERRLDPRGEREAVALGRWLADQNVVIDLVLCSPATRAQQTWAAAAAAFVDRPPVSTDAPIYEGGVEDLLQLINDASARTLAIVGHNPSVSSLVAELDADFDGELRPAAVAVVEMADESGAASGRVTAYWTPERR